MQPHPAKAESLTDLYRDAAAATARGSKSFYFATRFFPPDLARSAHAVYWFCRTTDDMVDEAPSVDQGRSDLDQWESELRRALSGRGTNDPVLRVFAAAVERHAIPHEYPLELIEGMRMDLNGVRYDNFEQLRVFCYRVASVVGLMMMHVIGFEGDPTAYATDLGIAMQLTNILRDVGEDLRLGRVYLPAEEMRRFGYSEVALRAGIRNAQFRELMAFQVSRARAFYRSATPGIPMLDPRGRFAVEVAARVYAGILSQIERADYEVFERRAVVPAVEKYWITARTMAVPMLRSSVSRMAFWRS